ncbi:sugar lactone lactonase YvrE [Nocardia sp. GAS34]|uniref:YncE family protein n=1 Tax=unclassified Nocardia TaxID=2637762 RepID=UPI003D255D10
MRARGESGARAASRRAVHRPGLRAVSRSSMAALLAVATAAALLSGCSKNSGYTGSTPAAAPGHAATAPATTATPAGTVVPSGPIAAALAEPATGALLLLDSDGVTVRILDPADLAAPARTVTLPARTTALTPGPEGQVLAAAGSQVLHIDPAAASVHATPVDGQVRSVAQRADGTVAAGLADGRVLILGADGHVTQTFTGLGGNDAIVAPGSAIVTLDRDRTTLTQVDIKRARPGLQLRAGIGAVNMITDHFGRMLVTDTAGGALLVYTPDPLEMHQWFPVGSSPYAEAYDQATETLWVSLTGTNEVVGYDLSTGIPEEVRRFATVRQPNSVTVDSRTGDLFVGSATGAGLQRIGADERKRGQ